MKEKKPDVMCAIDFEMVRCKPVSQGQALIIAFERAVVEMAFDFSEEVPEDHPQVLLYGHLRDAIREELDPDFEAAS